MSEWRVVLNRNVAYGATSATVLSKEAAFAVARDYWATAKPGEKVQIFVPADSRDGPDWQWIAGESEGPGAA